MATNIDNLLNPVIPYATKKIKVCNSEYSIWLWVLIFIVVALTTRYALQNFICKRLSKSNEARVGAYYY